MTKMPEMKTNSGSDVSHLIQAVDQELHGGRGAIKTELGAGESKLRVTLEDKELWGKFKDLTNEMIVTKSGR